MAGQPAQGRNPSYVPAQSSECRLLWASGAGVSTSDGTVVASASSAGGSGEHATSIKASHTQGNLDPMTLLVDGRTTVPLLRNIP
jgi:hypothetical protein